MQIFVAILFLVSTLIGLWGLSRYFLGPRLFKTFIQNKIKYTLFLCVAHIFIFVLMFWYLFPVFLLFICCYSFFGYMVIFYKLYHRIVLEKKSAISLAVLTTVIILFLKFWTLIVQWDKTM
jgi:hypothetical protein